MDDMRTGWKEARVTESLGLIGEAELAALRHGWGEMVHVGREALLGLIGEAELAAFRDGDWRRRHGQLYTVR